MRPNESKLVKMLRYGLYLVALTPLVIFSEFLSPFHFGKVVFFRSVVEIMVALYIPLALSDPRYRMKWDRISWVFLLMVVAFTISTLTSVNAYQSFWGTLERMGGLWTFWHYFAYFLILVSVIRSREDWLLFLKVTVVVGVLSAFYGFGQKTESSFFIGSGNRSRIFGTIGNPALFAGYQLFIAFISLILFLRPGSKRGSRLFFAFSGVISVLAILMTAVRGSILALIVGVTVFAALYYLRSRTQRAKRYLYGVLAVLAVLLILAVSLRNTDFVRSSGYLTRLTDFSTRTFTVQTRLWAWQAGIDGWNDSAKAMIIGWGPENFNVPFSIHFNPNFFAGPGSETLFDRAHNMFVEILVTMGIVGLVAYLWLFVAIFQSLRKIIREKPEDFIYGAGLVSLVIAYIIHNSFIFDTSANFILFFTTLGFIRHLAGEPIIEKPNQVRLSGGHKALAVVLVIAAIILLYRTNVIPSKANYATTRAVVAGWNKDFSGAMNKYKESLAYDTFGSYDFRHNMAQFILNFVSSGRLNPEREAALKFAIDEVQKNADRNRLDYLPHLYLSRLNIVLGKDNPTSPYNDVALGHANRALEISPTFVRTYYELAQVFLNKKEFSKGVEYFQRAIDLNPAVGITYWYWGLTELENGSAQKGKELVDVALTKNFSPGEGDLARLIANYARLKDMPRSVKALEMIIELNPNNAQYRASLAAAYASVGRIDDAVHQAREAARINPDFAPEAKAFVESLGRAW